MEALAESPKRNSEACWTKPKTPTPFQPEHSDSRLEALSSLPEWMGPKKVTQLLIYQPKRSKPKSDQSLSTQEVRTPSQPRTPPKPKPLARDPWDPSRTRGPRLGPVGPARLGLQRPLRFHQLRLQLALRRKGLERNSARGTAGRPTESSAGGFRLAAPCST